ncbi:hypothetical protein ACFYY2_20240 [Streptomyces sp. NPDC001822]|uniref:hypothetical protein n=1 Tax=Streptomyces sp. NPDC001822 TaxID=3364614 RepID=UPI0036A84BE3
MDQTAPTPARRELRTALEDLSAVFGGMTARPDEINCECHWGSAEELALLKVPDVPLDPDLLRRTWEAVDWTDHAAVLRRVLPQFAAELVAGRVEPLFDMGDVGQSFGRGRWQEWPADQAGAVRTFLRAWLTDVLRSEDTPVPAYEVFAVCAEGSGTAVPWLEVWEETAHPMADRHLRTAVEHWEYELLGGVLPWYAWERDGPMVGEMTAWLLRHAPARLRSAGASDDLLHRVRLLGLTGEARWDDPHWPGHRY